MARSASSPPLPRSRLVAGLGFVVAAIAPGLAASPTAASPSALWEGAATDAEASARALRYETAMHTGHELGKAAMAEGGRGGEPLSPGLRITISNRALQAFRDAAAADPTQADPHYYMALLLVQTRLDCRSCSFDEKVAADAVQAIDDFEARSPLDPRISPWLVTKRAILHTRLAGAGRTLSRPHLEAALADYRTLIDRRSSERADSEVVYGNMAETLMMLGDLDGAIEQYRNSLRVRRSSSNTLGLAVALDRDERGTEARTLIRDLGRNELDLWTFSVISGDTFYVPDGEEFYYRALIAEATGDRTGAIENYDRFLKSGAHPRFAARATANRDALRGSKRR
ncbi:MAG: hypothetical protein R3B48_19970 [Kofleriaceae bacterium]